MAFYSACKINASDKWSTFCGAFFRWLYNIYYNLFRKTPEALLWHLVILHHCHIRVYILVCTCMLNVNVNRCLCISVAHWQSLVFCPLTVKNSLNLVELMIFFSLSVFFSRTWSHTLHWRTAVKPTRLQWTPGCIQQPCLYFSHLSPVVSPPIFPPSSSSSSLSLCSCHVLDQWMQVHPRKTVQLLEMSAKKVSCFF